VTLVATTRSRRPASRARTSRPAGKSGGKRKPASKSSKPAKPSALREAARTQLQGHGTDAFALALVALGALTFLALATDLAGPFGRAVDEGVTAVLGNGAFLVPLGLIAVAGLLLWRRADEESSAPVRIGLGVVLIGLSVVGLLHVLGGAPDLSAPADKLRDAGGYLGGVVGGPLSAGVGTAGAAIVLLAFLSLGLLLASGLSLHRVAELIAAGLGHVRGWIGVGVKALTETPPLADLDESDAPPKAASRRATLDAVPVEVADEPAPEPEPEPEPEPAVERPKVAAPPPPPLEDATEIAVVEDDAGQIAIDLTAHGEWKLPTREILKRSVEKEVDHRLVEQGGEVLEATMRDFGVDAKLVGMTVGPTVTRYELELAPGVKVNRVTALNHDIAYAMASPDVRILAPIPGRSAIGVEVPNKQRQLVTLGDILVSTEAKQATHPLQVGLGRDIAGRSFMLNLSEMPHLLIAGQTGAGKSSCINSLITSILMRCTPEQVRMILVDPKRVELGQYNGLPHLLTEVVTNPKKAANALEWCVREMDMRYDLLAEVGVRDIAGYNSMFDRGDLPTEDEPDLIGGKSYDRLPYIVIVIDELNDLMMVAARDVEQSICRIAQMARAVGIHLVIATQRPSVDVITGVIKANVPSRLAFAVSTLADSRVILDQPGAEKLIGHGDMLLSSASSSKAQRIQGSWVDEECVRKVVAHWRRQVVQPQYIEGLQGTEKGSGVGGGDAEETDDLLFEAMDLVVRSGLGSTSMLQRKLRVGFSRAGRLMDLMERKGVVGPSEGSKARAVLMTVEELEAMEVRADA
jgi:DNA segregation ATPase FtsK/SpoIIIE, S-DNA-T family